MSSRHTLPTGSRRSQRSQSDRAGEAAHRRQFVSLDAPSPADAPPVTTPVDPEVLQTVELGLSDGAPERKRVIVIGAGMAGLVASYELRRQGHDVLVVEAQQRVGGRVYTLRAPFAPGLYAEAGAMRIPRAHDLTLRYCELFGLPMRPFVMGNPRGLVHLGGLRMTRADADRHPARLPFLLAEHEQGRTADAMWEEAIGDLRTLVAREGAEAWDHIVAEYDELSLYEFLRHKGWSRGAIEFFTVLNFLEADMHNSLVEILREDLGGAYVDMQEIVGGMDALPNAFYATMADAVRFGCEAFAIEHDAEGVSVHIKTEASHSIERADYVVVTVPFSVLRTIEVTPAFSPGKQRAIRQLNYHASTKILFQVWDRIWEADDGILGGATVTELPVRRLNYPTPDPASRRGVLLASYTWGQDALQWGAMDEETRLEEALDDISRIHPGIRDVYEVGASHAWYSDRWARGAFAMFAPGQQTELQDDIVRPEGRIHFAGEHCSLYHAWIQGSLESGVRAAQAIHEATGASWD